MTLLIVVLLDAGVLLMVSALENASLHTTFSLLVQGTLPSGQSK